MGMSEQTDRGEAGQLRSAVIATLAFVVAFAGTAAPIPLYSYYQLTVGIGDADVSMTIVSYLVGVLVVLFFAGSLSDAVGRRPLVAASLLLGIAGSALFLVLDNGVQLQLARFVQGASSGFAMSATSAMVIDAASVRYRTLGVTIASCGSLLGITVGSLATGLIGSALGSYEIVYQVLIGLSVLSLALLPLANETVHNRITVRKAVKPIVRVPAHLRRVFPIAAGAYICIWGVGMFFQSLSTPAAVAYFGADGPLIPSILLAASMAPSALGGPLEARLSAKTSLYASMLAFMASCAGLTVFLQMGAFAPFLVFVLLFSVAEGMGLSVSMRLLVTASNAGESAQVVSLINFTGYVGSTVMSLAMTFFATFIPLAGVFGFLAVMGLAAVIPGLVFARTRL